MFLPHFIQYYLLKCFRILLNFTTGFLFRPFYGSPEELPPLRDKVLLQPATVLARKIRRKEIRSADLVQAAIRRAKDVQPFINAVVDDDYDQALQAAKKADDLVASGVKSEQQLEDETPLLGVPVSIKEYIKVEGLYCTNGLVSQRGARASSDANVVRKLKAAGAIVFVKTNIPELCFSWDTGNKLFGNTRNPYDTRRMVGGSSGGEGALIGSGASIIGVGSDLGGSLRIPSIFNGIFCVKPTGGVIPDVGSCFELPERIANFYSNLGPMCRYAADLRLMMKILATPGKLDLDTPVDLKKLTIYYCEDIGDNPLITPVTSEVRAALRKAVKHFEDKFGVTAKKVYLESLQDSFEVWAHTAAEDGLPTVEDALSQGSKKVSLPWEILKCCFGLSNHTFRLLIMAALFKFNSQAGPEARKANLKKFRHLKAQFENLLKENCVFFYPTQPEPAPYLLEAYTKISSVGYTCIFNSLGYPVSQSPLGLSRGLPIGMQVVANSYGDNLTIAVAEELEKAFGGWVCPSPVA